MEENNEYGEKKFFTICSVCGKSLVITSVQCGECAKGVSRCSESECNSLVTSDNICGKELSD